MTDNCANEAGSTLDNMTSFPYFSQLPFEIQDAIWKAAIPPARPTVYPVTMMMMTTTRQLPRSPNYRHRSRRTRVMQLNTEVHNAAENGRSNSERMAILSSLVMCCRRASRVAIATYQHNKPKAPISITGLSHDIDTDCDLPMFAPDWIEHWSSLPGGDVGLRIDGPRRQDVRHWAMICSDPDHFHKFLHRGIRFCLLYWWQPETLYIVVDPKLLVPEPWTPEGDIYWSENNDADEGEYFSAFIRDYRHDYEQETRKLFYERDREYFRVSTEVVLQAGGLEEAAGFLTCARSYLNEAAKYEDILIKPFLFLSWKDV